MKPQYHEHEGHRIEIREREDKPELVIDNVPVTYRRLPTGQYFLDDYAYDWADDLVDLARRYLNHRRRAETIRAKALPKEK